MTATLKAYTAVSDEETVVVFGHRNDWALRKAAAGQMSHGEPEAIERITRAPYFDHFGCASAISTADYIAAGWWFECAGCSVRVDADMEYASVDLDEGEELDGPAYHPLHPGEVWCSSECRDCDRQRRFDERLAACNEYVAARDAALREWPGITVRNVYRQHYRQPSSLEVSFDWPGVVSPYAFATWQIGSDVLRIHNPGGGDVESWHAFTDSLRSPDRDPGDEHGWRSAWVKNP